jgi:hypothetical protein
MMAEERSGEEAKREGFSTVPAARVYERTGGVDDK